MKKLTTLWMLGALVFIVGSGCETPTTAILEESSSVEDAFFAAKASNGTTYNPALPSQLVECNLVDNKLSQMPHGDGMAPATAFETGPGGWRFSNGGGSFVTFGYYWNGSEYEVDAGRSNTAGNTGIINDYPTVLDLSQGTDDDQLVFNQHNGEITLVGGDEYQLPGQENGQVRINMAATGTTNGYILYEGCAKTPQITNFGFTVQEGGDFVQQEYFKAWAKADTDGQVVEYEWTEISTFKNINPNTN